ncbi:dTDP-glucose 4,6-dehydratase [Clostridium sp. NSJ-6]|uniref:dTDP-glucose 4,6-dehydratase n=1 Tax=Clostridium hominis TaxID=2763036 RepID=A0ABR7DAX9_9CLOT|nr:dTDP-glucose 4,6-dehydratase [Clostridium hominis]MBC5628547.1 dTDP-glucose 4,6-dehydratase [Clostridium hominis]MDU2672296.1 dTDP-glucose 4,6-dehydratase [Clostridium sp.]
MKTYLVTGGAGFIGSNFILFMLKKYSDIKIINLDKLTYAGNLDNLKSVENDERYIFIKGDICNKRLIKEIFKKYTIDYIVHFAAESHVDRSINNPEVFVKTNVLGTVTVLNAAKEVWEKDGRWKEGVKFVHISTDEVYGSLGDIGYFTEDTNLDPHSPYSASKASADLIVKSYYDTYKMPVNITRCSNNYGPFQFPEKLIPLIINNCIEKEELPIYGDGLNVRDWIYVEDHVRAIDMVINSGRIGEVYNIGGRNERTNIDIVKSIIDYFKKNVDYTIDESLIKFIEDRKGHDRRYGIDSTKINEELGWYPKMDFYVGMKKTIQWYLNNQDWINNIKLGEYKKYYNKMYK